MGPRIDTALRGRNRITKPQNPKPKETPSPKRQWKRGMRNAERGTLKRVRGWMRRVGDEMPGSRD